MAFSAKIRRRFKTKSFDTLNVQSPNTKQYSEIAKALPSNGSSHGVGDTARKALEDAPLSTQTSGIETRTPMNGAVYAKNGHEKRLGLSPRTHQSKSVRC